MPLPDDSVVTTQLALISQQLQSLIVTVKAAQDENRAWQRSHEEEERTWKQDHETRLRSLEKSSTEISARMTMTTIIQGSFTSVASFLAWLVGRQ